MYRKLLQRQRFLRQTFNRIECLTALLTSKFAYFVFNYGNKNNNSWKLHPKKQELSERSEFIAQLRKKECFKI